MNNKALQLDKLLNGRDAADLEDELNRLRQKAKELDGLMKKLGGVDPD